MIASGVSICADLDCICVTSQAQRAEVDSGSLLDELQQLIQAKADAAQQRADLDRCAAISCNFWAGVACWWCLRDVLVSTLSHSRAWHHLA